MARSHRIDRKTLKQDEFRTITNTTLDYITEHQKKIIQIAVIVLVIVTAFSVIRSYNYRNKINAEFMLSQAERTYNDGTIESDQERLEKAISQYEKVVISYPRTQSARWADTRIAKCYFELRDYEEALNKYNEVLDKTRNKNDRDSLLLQKGAVLESLGKYDEALETYNNIELRPATQHLSGIVMLATGRCYEQLGEYEKARDSYESITQLDENSPWRTEIEKRKEAVNKQIKTRHS